VPTVTSMVETHTKRRRSGRRRDWRRPAARRANIDDELFMISPPGGRSG
jgi:hypothetical protein